MSKRRHTRDADCTLDPSGESCVYCGVYHGDPCPACGGRGFHDPRCPASEAARRPRRRDLTGATYLDELGTASARRYAEVVKRQARDAGIPLPLPDADVGMLLDNTVRGLGHEGRLTWDETPDVRRHVFTAAWLREMDRQGVRA